LSNNPFFCPKNKTLHLLLFFGILILSFLLGIFFSSLLLSPDTNLNSLHREGGYKYINPLIDFESVDFIKTEEAKKLKDVLEERINNNNPTISKISVYYEDLNTGAWIGINEKETFALASLIKVPIMIAHYKIAETDPEHLKQNFVYSLDSQKDFENIDDNRTEGFSLKEGESYSIDEYINQLIIHSDNTALPFLLLGETNFLKEIDEIFSSLGLTNPYYTSDENAITVKDYATFFRILYNATYLNKEMSSKALELLTKVSYDEGLASGIPQNIMLANKYGLRTTETESGFIEQVHDCGIIYHPTKPYILCVMTRGEDWEILEESISEISYITYEVVNSQE
jgi:beta-lactamase class A